MSAMAGIWILKQAEAVARKGSGFRFLLLKA